MRTPLLVSSVFLMLAYAASASAQQRRVPAAPDSTTIESSHESDAPAPHWVGLSLGVGETMPCQTGSCGRVTVSGEWFRHLRTDRYVAVRATGLFEVALYDGGGAPPPSSKIGEAAALYGVQSWGRFVDTRLGSGLAFGDELRVRDALARKRPYVGLPLDAQVGLHLSHWWRFTLGAFGTRGRDFSYVTGVMGFEGGIE